MAYWNQETVPAQMEQQAMPTESNWDETRAGMAGGGMAGGGMTPGRGGWMPARPGEMGAAGGMQSSRSQLSLDMTNQQTDQTIMSPQSVREEYNGSLKAMLRQNKGNYLVATFLVGTQNTVSWEGILYEVGNDYVTIYQPGRDRYIVNDIYALKYMEFYDVQRRERCNELLRQEEYPR